MEQNEEINNLPEEEDVSYRTKEYVRRAIHEQKKDKGKAMKQNTVLVVLVVLIIAVVMLFTVIEELKKKDFIHEGELFSTELQLDNFFDKKD